MPNGRMAQFLVLAMVLCPMMSARADEDSDSKKGGLAPTVMDTWDLDKDFAKINQQWASVYEVLISDDYFAIQTDEVSAWSCGQQAGHIALVLDSIAEGIEKNLADPERNKDGRLSDFATPVFNSGVIPRGVGKAPESAKPKDTSRVELLGTLEGTHERWQAVEARKADLPGCPARFEHFAFGMLTSTDWVRFAAVHTAHHLKIIRDILKTTGQTDATFGKAILDAPQS